jgi:hypothetical protein
MMTSAPPKAKRLKAVAPAAEAPSRTPASGMRARAPLAERRSALNVPAQKRSGAGAGGGKRPAVVAAQKAKSTYGGGRRSAAAAAEDKENNGDDTFRVEEESSDSIETPTAVVGRQSEELERLKKKFAEVDAWEMDYESVDMGGTSSSWR